jgi:hypothetical protein
MKKLLLHIILFSYAIVMFKPAFPYLNDIIAHALFYQQHMATVHLENGKYHVHKEVVKNVKEENSGKNSLPEKKKNSNIYEYLGSVKKSLLPVSTLSALIYAIHAKQYSISPYLAYNYPPPRA